MDIREPFRRYVTDRGPMMAASLSFFAVMSLVPLAMVAISILGFVYGGTEAGVAKITEAVDRFMPVGVSEIRGLIESLFERRGEIGAFGLVVLLWTASSIFTNLQHGFDVAFGRRKTRGFWFRRLVAIAAVLALATILALFGVIMPFFQLFAEWYASQFGRELPGQPWAVGVVSKGGSLVFAVVVFTLLYRVFPRGKVTTRRALAVGAGFGILWELVRWVFGVYVRYGSGRAAIYGSLWGAMVLMIWIYVSFSIVLLGASTLADWERSRNQA